MPDPTPPPSAARLARPGRPGASSCERFVEELARLVRSRRPFAGAVAGLHLVGKVYWNFRTSGATASGLPTDGIKPELVAGGQDGEAFRHFRFHAGCALLGLPGQIASAVLDAADRRQAVRGRTESEVECLDNRTGATAGRLLAAAFRGDLDAERLREALQRLFCE